jgi:hypothetical protein
MRKTHLAALWLSASALCIAQARADILITSNQSPVHHTRRYPTHPVKPVAKRDGFPGLDILPYRPTPPHNDWRIIMEPGDPALLASISHDAVGTDGISIAHRLITALHANGFPTVQAVVDQKKSTILLRVAPVFAKSGPFSGFLPGGKTVTPGRIKSALPLLSAAAIAHHEHVNLGYDGPVMTATASPMPGRTWHVGTIFSSYGPRYAGSDVLSGYGYAHIDGFDISGSVTRGLPGLTPKQSRGGAYLGEAIEIKRPTPAGIFGFSFSHAHYLTGGPIQPLHLSGDVTQIKLGDRYPIMDGQVWLRGGFLWSGDTEKLGALDWWTRQRDASIYLGATGSYVYRKVDISWRATILHGIAGSDTAGPGQPNLMGRWSSSYAVERGRIEAGRTFNVVRLTGIFGFQHGSPGTPQVEQAYIGGENRGSSFFTGSFEAPSGYWWSAKIEKAVPVRFTVHNVPFRVTPYLGVNGGTVMPVTGPADSVAAFSIGAAFKVGRHISGQIGWSHTLAEPRGTGQHNMLGFEIVTGF